MNQAYTTTLALQHKLITMWFTTINMMITSQAKTKNQEMKIQEMKAQENFL
jgi:hypothetical protein